ncbi:piercer of microtubule wall 2 protein [Diceros bicornis minor]|uniref:piercer of microtubule wall 2 protein n=1 Tax=Diceros bicornis minor TaxID=77932 RepID=UPI0026E9A090|nr:piercer of microtubule wall 2 protein [Diceros bicornis minor]
MDSQQSERRSAPSQPSEGRRVRPPGRQNPAPLEHRSVCTRGSEAAESPDRTPQGPARAAGAADSRSEEATRAAANARRQGSSHRPSSPRLRGDSAAASARRLSRGYRPGPRQRPQPGGGGRRGAAAHAGTRSPARASGPAAAERRTTTPEEERSPPWAGCGKPGLAASIPTTSGLRRWRGAAAGCYGDGLLQPLERIRGSPWRTTPWIRRIGLYILIQPAGQLLFAALIGCSKKAASPGRSLAFLPSATEKAAFGEKIKKISTTSEYDWDKKSNSASNSDTEMKPEQLPPCVNPGNPVFSCMLDPKTLHTATSLSKPKMIMYKTNSSNYGEFLPMAQFFPCNYTPKEQVFSSHIRATGLYQNNTLNTAPDRTRTLDFPNFQHTL